MIAAKVLAVGTGKSFSVCIGQADFENDCRRRGSRTVSLSRSDHELSRSKCPEGSLPATIIAGFKLSGLPGSSTTRTEHISRRNRLH
jgi:hypothetical protein